MHTATLSSHLLYLFTSRNSSQFPDLRDALDNLSRELVSNKDLRVQIGSQHPSIWAPLHELWDNITRAHSTGIDLDGQQTRLVLSVAKFTRNLIADVPSNQKHAFPLEPHIRQLIYLYTAWTKHGNESSTSTYLLLNADANISNLVTGNQELLDQFWVLHMGIPEEQSIFIRLLGLPDLRTVLSVLVLVMNCITTTTDEVTASIGIRVCVSILDRLEGLLEPSELEDETKVFELGCALFSKLFQFGFFPELYNRTSMDDEPVSPTQITLLKLLDSFLQPVPTPFQDRVDYLNNLAGFLASVFLLQAKIAQCAIQQATGERPPDLNAPINVRGSSGTTAQAASCALDERLPGVWVALVLLSTSLSSILLNAEQEDDCGVSNKAPEVVTLTQLCYDTISGSRSRAGAGLVEELVETLRLLDVFLPRINFGKAKPPRPHSQTQNRSEVVPEQSARQTDAAEFPFLKRDLIRLLGILCHNSKAIQDRWFATLALTVPISSNGGCGAKTKTRGRVPTVSEFRLWAPAMEYDFE
ncbi:hypothetical protein BJV74DRAFT_884332 [Russula compacta]|nr:hypothetical protein BJV74DRAFT_884332 [Russula compacta]